MKSVFFLISLCSAISMATPEIVGQKARYNLDKDPKRTSSMIKNGTVDASVTQHLATEAPPSYEVKLDYKFNIQLIGPSEGSNLEKLDAYYFDPEFLENLRKNKFYEGTNFKAEHKGFADAKNLDGKVYKNCDVVLLYDITQVTLANTLFSFAANNGEEIQDLKVLVHIYPGIPVLGGVKIDASGKYNGMNVKAGGDYISPR